MNSDKNLHIAVIGSGGAAMAAALKAGRGARTKGFCATRRQSRS